MPISFNDLNRRFPFDLLLHVVSNWIWHYNVSSGLDYNAWCQNLLKNVPFITVKNSFGYRDGKLRSHSLQAFWEHVNRGRIVCIDNNRSKGLSPVVVVGFYVWNDILNLRVTETSFIIISIDVPECQNLNFRGSNKLTWAKKRISKDVLAPITLFNKGLLPKKREDIKVRVNKAVRCPTWWIILLIIYINVCHN